VLIGSTSMGAAAAINFGLNNIDPNVFVDQTAFV
jgi:hypothetical protein